MSLRNSLLVLLLLAAWPAEAQLRCATGDDACSRRGSGDGGGDLRRSSSSAPAARQLHAAAGSDGPLALDLGRAVVLHTQMGDIRIRLLERQAPRITQLVWDLAATRGCGAKQAYNCSFYRNEAPMPPATLGPPYGLLQGRMYDLAAEPPFEGNVEVRRGHVCFIPGGRDWFIALSNHAEWGTSHPVWGWVDEWRTVDAILQQRYNNWTNPGEKDGVTLRILQIEVPFMLSAEGDRTFVGTDDGNAR